jgi:hypothetical protein
MYPKAAAPVSEMPIQIAPLRSRFMSTPNFQLPTPNDPFRASGGLGVGS